MTETMTIVLWVAVFASLILAPFRRTRILFALTMGVWLASIILTAIGDPTPWGMDPAVVRLLTLFAVPLAGRLAGALAHQKLTGSALDVWNADGTDGFDALADQARARWDDSLHRS